MDLPDCGFAVYWALVISGYRVWIYQRVNLCILDIVHISEQTASPCRHSEHLYVDILCYWMLNGLHDTDISVSVDAKQITGQTAA